MERYRELKILGRGNYGVAVLVEVRRGVFSAEEAGMSRCLAFPGSTLRGGLPCHSFEIFD